MSDDERGDTTSPVLKRAATMISEWERRYDRKSRGDQKDPLTLASEVLALRTGPEIVVLCGSTRFIDRMAVAAWELEKAGSIALSCHLLPGWYADSKVMAHHQAEAEGVSEVLDELHLRKIDLADRVLVLNIDGYIGDSTRAEIVYAESVGKPIEYVGPVDHHQGEGH